MLPFRLVIDTNVLVYAAIKPAGLQRTVFLIAISKPARLYVSHPILKEYSEVLARPELRIRKGLRLQLLQVIKNHGHTVVPTRQLEATPDPRPSALMNCLTVNISAREILFRKTNGRWTEIGIEGK
jgi:uncharacterized protein